ncbi:MAG: feruloyl-CoA synthase [Thiolinea sp.]
MTEANELLCVPPDIQREVRDDGTQYLHSAVTLGDDYARCVGDWLEYWAKETPDAVFLAERGSDGEWQRLSYAEVRSKVVAIASWLLSHNLSAERPMVILSDNSVEHALLVLAGMHVGIPGAAISTGYSLLSQDHAKLKANIELLQPGVIFAEPAERYVRALEAVADLHDGVVVAGSCSAQLPDGAIPFSDLLSQSDEAAVMQAFAAVTPDTVAKFLFTSGSTGAPKAVINTQRMLTSSQLSKQLIWPFIKREKPVLVDWLPWSHTFGANHNFNMVLCNGGSLYVDGGKPAPGLIDTTLQNIRDISPNMYFSVPRAYDMLLPVLQKDEALREGFFRNLKYLFYAGAALPTHLWDGYQAMIDSIPGCQTVLTCAWGSTETSPLATDCHFHPDISGNIGVPVPGTTLKLVPNAGKLEVRVKGPNITPGYWKNPQKTAEAFDEEGYYLIGDAVKFVDTEQPNAGLLFDGRVSEDFKLMTGTWVHVGALRMAGIDALKPVAQDIVVTGHGRDAIGFLVFPNLPGCHSLCPDLPEDAPVAEVINHPAVQAHLQQSLANMKAAGSGSSTYASYALLLEEPPSSEAGEITDKGYINQRMVLTRRADVVNKLYESR